MKTILFSLTILIVVSCSTLDVMNCILPEADDSFGASPPQIEGQVVSTDQAYLVVVTSQKSRIKIFSSTLGPSNIFTQFGGRMMWSEIKKGYFVKVWTKNCNTSALDSVEAARVQVIISTVDEK